MPKLKMVTHSSVSWKINCIPLKYEKIDFDKTETVHLVLNTPADGLLWNRISDYLTKHNLKCIFIPKITINHLDEAGIPAHQFLTNI